MTHFAEWLRQIQALEVELHQPATRCDPKRVAALLHEDFEEIGRSGLRYDKCQTVAALEMEADYPQIFAQGFKRVQISAGTVLLTYKSFQRDAQGPRRALHRAFVDLDPDRKRRLADAVSSRYAD